MFQSALLAAIVAFIKALFGGKPKDPQLEDAKHDVAIAKKQAEIVADRSRPSASDSLHRGDF